MNLPSDLQARLSVASRIGAAVLGGYALASAAASALALSLPPPGTRRRFGECCSASSFTRWR